MLSICIICVGKLKERFYLSACDEYQKRLNAYAKLEIVEITEHKLPDAPSIAQVEDALKREGMEIMRKIPKGSLVIPMCIEGETYNSEQFAQKIQNAAGNGFSKICFIMGGSYGLSPDVKLQGKFQLSMSRMTFPHHLARVMLLEQIYRSFKIIEGSRYHK